MRAFHGMRMLLLLTAASLVAACGGDDAADSGDGDIAHASVIHRVGGTVYGLAGTGLMLQNNGSNNLTISANGDFTFTTALGSGTNYEVTVLAQPSAPSQTCIVNDGSGTIASADITNVAVICTTNLYTVGGTVTGLSGSGLVLQNNAGENLAISAPGTFTFTGAFTSGTTYNVFILTQPSVGPSQSCVVANGTGTVTNTAVTSIAVTCTLSSTNSIYAIAAGAFLFAANSATGAASVLAIDALNDALALVMPVTY